LNGAVVEIGAAHGVPTPRNATLLALVRAREASYGQGKN
jgi:ketopantoate reductase